MVDVPHRAPPRSVCGNGIKPLNSGLLSITYYKVLASCVRLRRRIQVYVTGDKGCVMPCVEEGSDEKDVLFFNYLVPK